MHPGAPWNRRRPTPGLPRRVLTLTFLLAVALAPAANAAAPGPDAPPADPAALAFADALRACTAATHDSPHPFVRGFTSAHVVVGEREGRCAYTQTMPGGMVMECAFDAAHRADMADQIAGAAAGNLSGGTSRQPAWAGDCEIVTADGKRMPFGG